jgi:hypothetical protein
MEGAELTTLLDVNASRVPGPDAVSFPTVKADGGRERSGLVENLARFAFYRSILNYEFDPLVRRQVANDFRIDPRDRLKLSRPVVSAVRPSEPSRGVRFPLGGHAVLRF